MSPGCHYHPFAEKSCFFFKYLNIVLTVSLTIPQRKKYNSELVYWGREQGLHQLKGESLYFEKMEAAAMYYFIIIILFNQHLRTEGYTMN